MLLRKKIYHSNELSAFILTASYSGSYTENDYNPRPCVSFPLHAAFRYQSGQFSATVDCTDVLIEQKGVEFQVSKFHPYSSDSTLVFQFNESSWPFALNRHVNVHKRSPELENYLRYFIDEQSCLLGKDELVQLLFESQSLLKNKSKFNPWHSIKIEKAKEFIHTSSDREISIRDIAEACSASPFHFSRVFKSRTGYSPYAYLTKVRIEKAKQLLIRQMPVTSVAFEVGFTTIANFSYCFRKETGISPEQFKKSKISKKY